MLSIRPCLVVAALLASQGSTRAQEAAGNDAAPPGLGTPLSIAVLEDLRGGTDTTVNDVRLNGETAGNSAFNVSTGSNAVSSGAFSAMSGIPVVIQNTGANVLIQNAVILNLQVQ